MYPVRRIRRAAAIALAVTAVPLLAVTSDAAAQCASGVVDETSSFGFTGGEQCYVVPDGVIKLNVTATGASGADGINPDYGGATSQGGRGSKASVTEMPVTPGQVLYVEVGNDQGYNGGGHPGSYYSPGWGGGASDVRTCSATTGWTTGCDSLTSRLVVGAGGGGAGGEYAQGGDAPGGNGENGYAWSGGNAAGYGATEWSPGYEAGAAEPGGFGYGGAGELSGGGGGGGWYGGGGGTTVFASGPPSEGGGGAGSSHVPNGCATLTCVTSDDPAGVTIHAVTPDADPPGTPTAPTGPSSTKEHFTVDWADVEDFDTYTLQRNAAAVNSVWTEVATGLVTSSYTFSPFSALMPDDGTHTFRVIAVNAAGSSSPSEASAPVKVDRVGPSAPVASTDRAAEDTAGGWFKDTVTVSFGGSSDPVLPDGTAGVGGVTYTAPSTRTTTSSFAGRAYDALNNPSELTQLTVKVDALAPTVSITGCPTTALRTGDPADINVAAAEQGTGSGLAVNPSGVKELDTGAPGEQTVTYTATDRVGHNTSASCTFRVTTVPTPPGIVYGKNPNNGAVKYAWAVPAHYDDDATLTYSLQRSRTVGSVSWKRIAFGLSDSFYSTMAGSGNALEPEGTWLYRAVAGDGYTTSAPSTPSKPIKVDRTRPPAPALSIASGQTPAYTDSGTGKDWYLDTLTIAMQAFGDPVLADGTPGSGLGTVAPFNLTAHGTTTLTRTVSDKAGNASLASAPLTVNVDARAPALSVGCPPWSNMPVGYAAKGTFSAADSGAGLVGPSRGTFPLDTSTAGTHTASHTVYDKVGHSTTRTCQYTVVEPAPEV
jgi:hypothetical protein